VGNATLTLKEDEPPVTVPRDIGVPVVVIGEMFWEFISIA